MIPLYWKFGVLTGVKECEVGLNTFYWKAKHEKNTKIALIFDEFS